jgi:hypothetical protein
MSDSPPHTHTPVPSTTFFPAAWPGAQYRRRAQASARDVRPPDLCKGGGCADGAPGPAGGGEQCSEAVNRNRQLMPTACTEPPLFFLRTRAQHCAHASHISTRERALNDFLSSLQPAQQLRVETVSYGPRTPQAVQGLRCLAVPTPAEVDAALMMLLEYKRRTKQVRRKRARGERWQNASPHAPLSCPRRALTRPIVSPHTLPFPAKISHPSPSPEPWPRTMPGVGRTTAVVWAKPLLPLTLSPRRSRLRSSQYLLLRFSTQAHPCLCTRTAAGVGTLFRVARAPKVCPWPLVSLVRISLLARIRRQVTRLLLRTLRRLQAGRTQQALPWVPIGGRLARVRAQVIVSGHLPRGEVRLRAAPQQPCLRLPLLPRLRRRTPSPTCTTKS